jgi:HK97 family phage portal protein
VGLLTKVERRASLENPSTSLADPDAWLIDAFGGGETASGKSVNHHSALKLSAVWACTKVISEDVAKLPLPVYQRLERGKERAREHPLYRALNTRFNPEMSAYNGRRTLQAHVLNWGAAFAEIERNGMGDIIGLWPLLPDRTRVERVGGRKIVVTRVGGKDVPLDADTVLHIPGLGFDGLRSYSVIGMARQAIASALAAEEYGARFFGGGAIPGGVIKRKDTLSEQAQARLRRSWNAMHQGLTGAQRIAILDEGMEYEKIGIPPEDAQFISARQHGVEDVIRYYRVPPHKVQHLLHAGVRANVEAENISYVTDTLQSWLVCWEQEINGTLFELAEQSEFFAEHLVEGLLRGDSAARSDFYQRGINNGWLTPNEAREMENRNPMEGGDRLFVPLNLVPLDSPMLDEPTLGAPPSDDAPEDDDDAPEENARGQLAEVRARRSATERYRLQRAHMRPFASAAKRVLAKEVQAVREILARTYTERGAADFRAELERFYRGFTETVVREIGPLIAAYASLIRGVVADETGSTTEPDVQYEKFVEDYTAGMARRHVRKSRRQLEAIVRDTDEAEVSEAIEDNLVRWQDTRPEKIALSETVRAGGAFARTAYTGAGVLYLRWVAFGKSCPYCARLDGKVVGVQDNFVAKGDVIEPVASDDDDRATCLPETRTDPSEPYYEDDYVSVEERAGPMTVKANAAHAPLHAACDCSISAAL